MFENETKIDLDTNMKMTKNLTHKSKFISCILSGVVVILGIAFLLLEIYVFKEGDYFLPIFFIVFGAAMVIIMLFLPQVTHKISGKMMQVI